jgi:hypothetical protein
MGKYGGHMGKYGGHMGKNGEPIYDLGHMGISLELNSGKIMADIWELPVLLANRVLIYRFQILTVYTST